MKHNQLQAQMEKNPRYRQAVEEVQLHFKLANAILRARLHRGWSQTDLAHAVGTKQANISRIEAGLANPTLDLVHRIATALDLEIFILEAEKISPEVSS